MTPISSSCSSVGRNQVALFVTAVFTFTLTLDTGAIVVAFAVAIATGAAVATTGASTIAFAA